MEKINIVELLKDCPQGMELDCTMYDNLHFDKVDDYDKKIHCYIQYKDHRTHIMFGKDGTYNSEKASKCVIFPKGKTTWEGFVPPCKFKYGDIIFSQYGDLKYIAIVKTIDKSNDIHVHCLYGYTGAVFATDEILGRLDESLETRFATEEEKRKLFQAIKDNGYKWNPETKTLEKLIKPKFNVGDKIRNKNTPSLIIDINNVDESSYYYGCSNVFLITDQDNWELVPMITPKFKIGDKIRNIRTGQIHTVTDVYGFNEYISFQVDYSDYEINYKFQDQYELVPNKFDINTLRPFDKVLVRDCDTDKWNIDFFAYYREDRGDYQCMTFTKNQCIPYESNKYLMGTTNSCSEYFKTWK